jgi:hypothetical protein
VKWPAKRPADQAPEPAETGPALIHALDGFLAAGGAPRLAADNLLTGHGEIVHSFEVDRYIDYRARRPLIGFFHDHYQEYADPRLDVVLEHDTVGAPYFVLAGPEPDFAWESFIDELQDVVQSNGIVITLGLGAVPMGVPHTRPAVITTHATRPELIDRVNLWTPELQVPGSAQALLEYRFGQRGLDAAGYVVHVPHYVSQVEYPPGAVALLDAVVDRTGLQLDYGRTAVTSFPDWRSSTTHLHAALRSRCWPRRTRYRPAKNWPTSSSGISPGSSARTTDRLASCPRPCQSSWS